MTGLLTIVSILLINLNTSNNSPGALDNASGMAVVFGLSSYFVDHPLKHFNIWFVQFSAEEIGTMGSRVFVNNHEDEFERGKVFQFNIDLLSGKGLGDNNRIEYLKSFGIIPRDKLTSLLGKYLRSAASKKNISIYGIHFATGAHTDSLPFRNREYDTIDLGTMEAAKWAHTEKDTPDKVDPEVISNTCVLLRETLLEMDEDYHQLVKMKK
jgi:Zn-dependent M28 family amino/carboxypeptidase